MSKTQVRSKRFHPVQLTKRWKAVDAIIRKAGGAHEIAKRLAGEHGIQLSFKAVWNWRIRGVAEACIPAVAGMAGMTVEEVLKASGKI